MWNDKESSLKNGGRLPLYLFVRTLDLPSQWRIPSVALTALSPVSGMTEYGVWLPTSWQKSVMVWRSSPTFNLWQWSSPQDDLPSMGTMPDKTSKPWVFGGTVENRLSLMSESSTHLPHPIHLTPYWLPTRSMKEGRGENMNIASGRLSMVPLPPLFWPLPGAGDHQHQWYTRDWPLWLPTILAHPTTKWWGWLDAAFPSPWLMPQLCVCEVPDPVCTTQREWTCQTALLIFLTICAN